jgi:hypothetical protein
MTDGLAILTSLDQFIERFASQTRLMFGHQLAPQEDPMATAKVLTEHEICHSGHFGHSKEEALAGADHEHCNSRPCPAGIFAEGRAGRIISVDGQSGQSGQSLKNHGLDRGHRDSACGDCGQTRWRAQYEERSRHHELGGGRSRAEVQLLAWRDLEWRWHKEYGERLPRGICGGCRKPIGKAEVIPLIDGNRVHRGEQHECLIAYGRRWRGAARAALLTLGLKPPRGAEN